MALRINNFGRQIFSLRGIFLRDYSSSSKNSLVFTSRISSNISLTQTIIPPASVNLDELFNKEDSLKSVFSSTKLQILDRPIIIHSKIITELPLIKANITYEDKMPEKEIKDPESKSHSEKHAIRMIVIRNRKMRIHKLKKFRKKMKFVIAKYKQKRKMEKEKQFQAELLAKIKEAEKFDPLTYVKEKIRIADEELIPKLWRGKRLPEFVIRELMERKKKKMEDKLAKEKRRSSMSLNPSDYK